MIRDFGLPYCPYNMECFQAAQTHEKPNSLSYFFLLSIIFMTFIAYNIGEGVSL